MKKLNHLMILVIFFSVVFFNSCGSGGSEGVSAVNDNDDLTYWVIDYAEESWYQITTELRAENADVKIYVDVNAASVTDIAVNALADEFANPIYTKVTANFGLPYDVDGDGKVRIVILDIRDDFASTGVFAGGYFYPLDILSQSQVNISYPGNRSNEGDIIYIDCNPQDITTREAAGTIAHELQHMINFSKYLTSTTLDDQADTWINEGFSEAASHMCYGQITDRINFFNNATSFDTSYIAGGQSLFYWDNTDPKRNLMNYSLSYLFFQYLRSQSAKKDAIFMDILNTTNNYINNAAIEEAMAGDDNLKLAVWNSAGSRFNTLLLRWYAANTSEIGTSPLYSYDSEIITQPDLPLYGSTSVTLDSGAGVVKTMSSTFTGGGTGYVYLSVNSSGSSEDFTSTFINNGYIVAVYTPYDTTGLSSGTSSLPSSNILPGRSAVSKSPAVKRPMMIDPVFSFDGALLKKNKPGAD